MVVVMGFMSYGVTRAFFADTAVSQNNTFTAAAQFPTATPSATITSTPTPTPTIATEPVSQTAPIYVSNPFTCSTGASNTTTTVGSVKFTKDTSFDIELTVSSASANTTYQLWVNQDPGACPLGAPTVTAFLTTDENGNAVQTLNDHPIVGGATNFWISLVAGGDVFRSTAVGF